MVIPPSGLQAAFRDLLDKSAEYVRSHEKGEARTYLLRQIEHPWRLAADASDAQLAPGVRLHAFEKFLSQAWTYAGGRPGLRHDLMPFVEAAVLAREKAGQAPDGEDWSLPDDPSPAA
jgi:hypothetical protein